MTVKVKVKSQETYPGSPCPQCLKTGCNGYCGLPKTIASLPNIGAVSYSGPCFKCGSYACNGSCAFAALPLKDKKTKCQICDGYGERKPPEWRSEEKFVECKVCSGKGVI